VCALVFLSTEQRIPFDREVARYNEHSNDPADAGYLDFLAKLANPVIERVPPGANGLDYGCGQTPALEKLLTNNGRPTASYDPVYHPKHWLLKDAHYDFITMSEVLEHVHEPLRLLSRLRDLLRPRGVLGVMTQFVPGDAEFADWWYRRDSTHVCFYCERTMRWVAANFGWTLELPVPNVAIFRA
jgi:SAM-dependent methyltransferase